DGRVTAGDGYGAAVDENLAGRVAACHDRVIETVAEHRQQAGGREKAGLNSHGHSPFEIWPQRRCALAATGVEWGVQHVVGRLGADAMTGLKSNSSPS